MMTAEQFWQQWITDDLLTQPAMVLASTRAKRFAEAYAAAQLAEKEREIAQLRIDYQQELFHTEARAEAAEERLKEAQAENERLRRLRDCSNERDALFANVESLKKVRDDLRERLRQREAELEQLRTKRDKLEEAIRSPHESF